MKLIYNKLKKSAQIQENYNNASPSKGLKNIGDFNIQFSWTELKSFLNSLNSKNCAAIFINSKVHLT